MAQLSSQLMLQACRDGSGLFLRVITALVATVTEPLLIMLVKKCGFMVSLWYRYSRYIVVGSWGTKFLPQMGPARMKNLRRKKL